MSSKTKNGTSGPATTRPCSGTSCSASLWYIVCQAFLDNWNANTSTIATSDSLHLQQSGNKYMTRILVGVYSQSGVIYDVIY